MMEKKKEVIEHEPMMTLTIHNFSGFPNARSRILAAIIDANPPLQAFHNVYCSIASNINMQFDKRQLKPHITLLRLKSSLYIPDHSLEETLRCRSLPVSK